MDRRHIESLHEQASEHYVRGEFLEAIAAWKQILDLDPDDEKAREGLRVSTHLDQSALMPPPDGFEPEGEADRLRACLAEVESRIDSGDLHGAMRAAELLRVEHPDDPGVLSVLAKAYSLAGEADKAAEMMGRFLASSPEYAAAAALLEECRQVSPHESHLGSVVVRAGESGSDSEELEVVGTTGGVFALESAQEAGGVQTITLARGGGGLTAAAGEEKGLAVPEAARPGAPSPDAPAAALRERVGELIRQARAAKADGRHDDALGFVSRILILDDGNDEAIRLEEEIRKLSGAAEREVERLITEGAHLFDLGRLEESRQIFLQVLERSPSHREAVGYLERVDAQMARSGTPAAAVGRARGKVWNAPGTESEARFAAPTGAGESEEMEFLETADSDESTATAAGAAVLGADPAPARVPFAFKNIPDLIGRRFLGLILVGATCILLTFGASWWFTRDAESDDAGTTGASEASAAAGKAKRPAAKGGATAGSMTPLTKEQQAARIAEFFAQGESALTRKDYEAAIVAFNEVVRLDPQNDLVRGRILAAGEEYKKYRTDAEKLAKARSLFAAGEYESALRMIYRLPDGMLAPELWDRYKLAGWYNLGVVALRGANCKEAVAHLSEAMIIAPDDTGVRAARELADRCHSQSSDRSFYNRADSLQFRALDPPALKPSASASAPVSEAPAPASLQPSAAR